MKPNTHLEKSKPQIRPRRVREMYARLALAPDEHTNPIVSRHVTPSRQELLRQIAANDNAAEGGAL